MNSEITGFVLLIKFQNLLCFQFDYFFRSFSLRIVNRVVCRCWDFL